MAKVIYSGVNSTARKVKNLYVGVNNTARKIKKGYIGVNNIARLCYSSGYVWARYNLTSTTKTVAHLNRQTCDYIACSTGYYPNVIIGSNNEVSLGSEIYKSNTYEGFLDIGGKMNKYYGIYSYKWVTSYNSCAGFNSSGQGRLSTISTVIIITSRDSPAGSNIYSGTIYSFSTSTSTTYSRGSFIDYVTSDNINAYPTNNYQGSYWYVRQ